MGGPCDKVAEHGRGDYGSIWAGVAADEKERAEKWKGLAESAMLVLRAFSVGNATQAAIQSAIDEESDDLIGRSGVPLVIGGHIVRLPIREKYGAVESSRE